MQNNNCKNQNQTTNSNLVGQQLPNQVVAEFQFDIEAINYAIGKLSAHDDAYSTGIVKVFTDYLEHQNFRRMRDDLELLPRSSSPTYKKWDINTHGSFLEVIYPNPSVSKGGQNG